MNDYAEALRHVKAGGRAARRGWNGKGMFIFLEKGSAPRSTAVEVTTTGDLIAGVSAQLYEDGDQGTRVRLPSLGLKTATGEILIGWLASQMDQLAEDWTLLDG